MQGWGVGVGSRCKQKRRGGESVTLGMFRWSGLSLEQVIRAPLHEEVGLPVLRVAQEVLKPDQVF